MSSTIAFPYRIVNDETVALEDWKYWDDEGLPKSASNGIPGWDYDAPIVLTTSVSLNPMELVELSGMSGLGAEVSLMVSVSTGPSKHRWIEYRTDIPMEDSWEQGIRMELNSASMAEQLILQTDIILANDLSSTESFVARHAGSRLFSNRTVIQLEGSLDRFPMDMLTFGTSLRFLGAPSALWYLDWDPSRPDSQFLGTVLLYINSDHEDIARLVQAADPAILSTLKCDVIRAMCQALLRNEEFVSQYAEYESGTVGGQVRDWLVFAFDDQGPKTLKSQLNSDPSRFEARLQDRFS